MTCFIIGRCSVLPAITATLLSTLALGRDAQGEPQGASPPNAGPPAIDAAGTVHLPAIDLPLSSYMSAQARQRYIEHARNPPYAPLRALGPNASIAQFRAAFDEYYRPFAARGKALYPVDIQEQQIAGVHVSIVTPKEGVSERNRHRVLINLHQGAYSVGGGGLGGQVESIPIAGVGKFKVIAVDYRLAPEHLYPAATEDVVRVYKQLLASYEPRNIGIYGLSAGAALAAQVVARLQKAGLPLPGAIGSFGFGADTDPGGDSRYIGGLTDVSAGIKPPYPGAPNPPPLKVAYLANADLEDPAVSPLVSPAVLAKFPPTLLIAGTRDELMSTVVYAHTQLVKVGVDADLHLWEGMGHFFLFEMDLPESKEAYEVIARFFDKHLSAQPLHAH